jgi:ERCC4-type nuclease
MTTIDPNFTIIIDTREQQPWTFDHYATAHRKLDAGDYSIEGFENLLGIERKKSINEIANNIIEPRFSNAIARLAQLKYSFLLLEFDMEDVLNYPIGSNLPKRLWDKVKISPAFIMKHILDWQLKHNIKVLFCGCSSNAEKTAEFILKKIYYMEKNNKEPKHET